MFSTLSLELQRAFPKDAPPDQNINFWALIMRAPPKIGS